MVVTQVVTCEVGGGEGGGGGRQDHGGGAGGAGHSGQGRLGDKVTRRTRQGESNEKTINRK